MKYRSWLAYIAIGVILGTILYGTGLFQTVFSVHQVRASTSVDDVLQTVLVSHTKWSTLQGNAQFTWYSDDGSIEVYQNKFVISQPSSAYVEITNTTHPGSNEGIWISDGKSIFTLDPLNKIYSSEQAPSNFYDLSMLPKDLNQIEPGYVYLHPMVLHIGAPVMEYLYSSWWPQQKAGDSFTLLSADTMLNRSIWVVNHQSTNGDSETAWIDQATGIILQFHQILHGSVFLDMKISDIEVDRSVNSSLFRLPSGYSLSSSK